MVGMEVQKSGTARCAEGICLRKMGQKGGKNERREREGMLQLSAQHQTR